MKIFTLFLSTVFKKFDNKMNNKIIVSFIFLTMTRHLNSGHLNLTIFTIVNITHVSYYGQPTHGRYYSTSYNIVSIGNRSQSFYYNKGMDNLNNKIN